MFRDCANSVVFPGRRYFDDVGQPAPPCLMLVHPRFLEPNPPTHVLSTVAILLATAHITVAKNISHLEITCENMLR